MRSKFQNAFPATIEDEPRRNTVATPTAIHNPGQTLNPSNGTTNGASNATTNGNANSHPNGQVGGYSNGYTNGHANGHVNGHNGLNRLHGIDAVESITDPAEANYPIPSADKLADLRDRQREVLYGLARGLSEKEVAGELGISHNTVHAHVKELHRHFVVNSRGELLSLFLDRRVMQLLNKRSTGD